MIKLIRWIEDAGGRVQDVIGAIALLGLLWFSLETGWLQIAGELLLSPVFPRTL